MAERPVRVLVVDDSAFMRRIISELLTAAGCQVVGTARDGRDALAKAAALAPDVITLDVEMPVLDGYGTLRELMHTQPLPVVMVSSLTRAGAEATVRALALGAVDFLAKPSGAISLNMHTVAGDLAAKVKAAATATPRYRRVVADLPELHREKTTVAAGLMAEAKPAAPKRLVVIGCSTGGPGALHQIMPHLPRDLDAAVLVVQHMPAGFTRSLATRLDAISAIRVREAADGDALEPGLVLIAPGGQHMLLRDDGRVTLSEEPPLHGVRPAVDKLLLSVANHWHQPCLGVILTGMGHDGARGIAALKRNGGQSIAEDASTCVVYGMPRAVVELGLADDVLPVHEIPAAIVRHTRARRDEVRA